MSHRPVNAADLAKARFASLLNSLNEAQLVMIDTSTALEPEFLVCMLCNTPTGESYMVPLAKMLHGMPEQENTAITAAAGRVGA